MTDLPRDAAHRAGQKHEIADLLGHWVELIDEGLAQEGLPLPNRPLQAVRDLLRSGFVEVGTEAAKLPMDSLVAYVDEPWFRALYLGVEQWYFDHYGEGALRPHGNKPFTGVTLIRGTPFLMEVPVYRGKVEIEGKTAWMYFESGVHESEDATDWLLHHPPLAGLSEPDRALSLRHLNQVARGIRAIHHHLLGAPSDEISAGFRHTARSTLESAARRISEGGASLAPAWHDLQMAMEAALKLAIHANGGCFEHIHKLKRLVSDAEPFGVVFNPSRLDGWPSSKISGFRYGHGNSEGVAVLFDAYLLALDLVVAAVKVIEPPVGSGSGLLIRCAPWLLDD